MKKKKFDKYWHYLQSVQTPRWEVKFIRNCYRQLKNKEPRVFREDFCFTFALCCEWIKLNAKNKAVAVDVDQRPLEYGKKHYLSRLSLPQQKRMKVVCSNVLNRSSDRADIIGALNFSYFALKKRAELKKYFMNCLRLLNRGGLLILDCFGGSQCMEANEDRVPCGDFVYYWDQSRFDPVSHEAKFYIHYKRKNEKKRERVFKYDWRCWTIPELKDLLKETGFRKTHIYWEGTDKDGEGSGRFARKKKGEECESWVAYLMSEK